MLEHSAQVVKIENGATYVIAKRDSACGSCNTHGECGSLTLTRFFGGEHPFRVRNPIDAKPGDEVTVGVADGALGRSALLVYGVPLLLLFLSAFAGSMLAPAGEQLDAYAGLGALAGIILAGFWIRFIGDFMAHRSEFEPVILERHGLNVSSHLIQWRK